MRFGLRQKVSLGISMLVLGTAVLVGTITNVTVTRAIEGKIQRDLLAGQHVFEEFQRLRFQELLTSAGMLAEIPHLKAVVTTPDIDHATVLDSAQAIQQLVHSDLLMICDSEGRVLASVTEPARHGDDVAAAPAFANALRGVSFQGVWTTAAGIYQVVAVPFLFDNEVAGALAIGFVMDRATVKAMETMTNSHVALMSANRVVASSSAGAVFERLAADVPRARGSDSARTFVKVLGGQRYLALTAPFGAGSASYVLARSLDDEMRFYHRLQRKLLGITLGVLLVALMLGLAFSGKITRPIQGLVEGTQRIASGDFASKISVSSADELGQLAGAFNHMTSQIEDLLRREKELAAQAAVAATEQKRSQELAHINAQLERSNKELDDFTYIVSHDLKEPLRSIDAFSRFLEEEMRGVLTDESRRYLERIQANAGRMKALIEDLLELSRLAKRPNQWQQVPITTVLDNVKGRFDYLLQERHVQLVVQDGLPVLICDPVRLGEVFANLISNAIKYNDKPQPRIEIGGRALDGFYEFFVKDNGPGIEPKDFEKIFEIFQRLGKKGDQEGTGVGLAIVKKIVELHRGRVRVESALGQGAAFYFTVMTDEQTLLGNAKLAMTGQR